MGNITPYSAHLPDAQPPSHAGSSEWRELWAFFSALKRRRRLFIAVVTGFVLLVGIATVLTPKSYTTTVRMMAGTTEAPPQNSNTSLPILNALIMQNGVQSAETFATLAQQESVAADVADTLHLNTSPAALLDHVTVTPTVNTAILNIAVSWHDPQTSARIANAFADAFMRKERDFVRSEAVAAMGFLSGELPRAEAAMRRTGSDLARFQAENGFVDAGSHTQDVVTKETTIESKIQAVELDQREAQALQVNASAQLASLPATISNARQISANPVLTDLQTKLEQVNLQLTQAEEQYTNRHPLVLQLKKQRTDLMAQIAREPAQVDSGNTISPNPVYQALQQQIVQYRQRIDGDSAQLALLRQDRTALTPLLKQLPEQSMELATLQQRAKLASDVYNALQQKYNDATVARTTAISDVTVVQPATPDSATVRPQLTVNLLVALVVGLLLGLVTVSGLEMYEHPVRGESDSAVYGLPVIARIPMLTTTNRRMLPWLQSMTAEAFLRLCVALKLKNEHPLHTLAVVSASRNDGKSTVAFNLAKAMASLEPRILLIDADLRRPILHGLASVSNKYGLSDLLEGTQTFEDVVKEIAPNLDFIPAGHSVDNPVALMKSRNFDSLIEHGEAAYSMVIIDTPAISCVTDGLLITAKTDAAVLVLAAGTANERLTQQVVSQFAALGLNNLIGVVLNRDRKRVDDYSDYFVHRRSNELPGGAA